MSRGLPSHQHLAQIQQALEHFAIGVELRDQENFQEAIAEYDQAIQLYPKSEAYNHRGNAYFDLGRLDRAVEDYDAAIASDGHYFRAYNNRGVVYARLGQLDRAIDDYTQAILYFLDYAEAYLNRGNAYYNQNEFERAVKGLGDAITLDPELALAYAGRALALTRLNRDAEAHRNLERAVKLGVDRSNLEALVQDQKNQR